MEYDINEGEREKKNRGNICLLLFGVVYVMDSVNKGIGRSIGDKWLTCQFVINIYEK